MRKKIITVLSVILAVNIISGCTSVQNKNNDVKTKSTTTSAITTKGAVTTTKSAITTASTVIVTPAAVSTAAVTSTVSAVQPVTASTIPAVAVTGPAAKILATINGYNITEADVNEEYENLPEQYKPYYSNEDGKKRILENLINQKILMSVALKTGIDKDEGYLKDMEKLKERVLANYAVRKNILDKVKATDEELAAKYNEQKESFKTNEEVKASHILFMFKPDMKEEDKKLLLAKAEGLLKEITAGKDFAESAKANSDDGSAANGGNLGWFGKGMMVKPFEDACFEGEVGKVYPKVIETQFGYHIIKVDEKKPESYKSIEEVKESLSDEIVQSKRNEAFNKWMEELKKEYIK